MRIVEKTTIDRPIEKVWPFIIRPESFQKWNNKIVAMEAKDEFRLGQPFTTRYRMSSKEIQCLSTVTAIEKERFLELRHSNCIGPGIHPELEVWERISLARAGEGTLVTKEVLIKNHRIPWIFAAIIWLVNRFGRPAEPDRLKLMCEADRSPAPPAD